MTRESQPNSRVESASQDSIAPQNVSEARANSCPSGGAWWQSEVTALGAILLVFFVVNVATAERSPTIWQDEVMFADPSINLLMGRGLTSTAWYAQPKEQLWAGNAPLHTLLLVPWVFLWGLSPTSVRSVNFVYAAAAGVLLWYSARRLRLLQRPALRLAFVALILCGQGVAFGYRSGRYDSLGLLVIAGTVSARTVSSSRVRGPLLLFLGFLLPLTGLQLIPFAGVLGILLIVLLGESVSGNLLSFVIGCLGGVAALVLGANLLGVWDEFRDSVLFHSGGGLWHREPVTGYVVRRGLAVKGVLGADLSAVSVLLCAALAAARGVVTRSARWRSPEVFGLAVAAAVPLGMSAAGRFCSAYSWMVFVPVAACCFVVLERWLGAAPLGGKRPSRAFLGVFCGLLLLATVIGLPLRLARTLLEWEARNYRPVQELVRTTASQVDWIYCDFPAYYAAKQTAAVVFLPSYRTVMRTNERERVALLVVRPENVREAQAFMGGRWKKVGAYHQGHASGGLFDSLQWLVAGQVTARYDLVVLRRLVDS